MPKPSKLSDEIGAFTAIPNSVIEMWSKFPELCTEKEGPSAPVDALALFVYLRYRTNGVSGKAFPSYDTICKDTGLTRRRIAAAVRVLIAAGLVERVRRFGDSSLYTLKMPALVQQSDCSAVVQQSDYSDSISTADGLSLVQQVHTNKTDLTKTDKKIYPAKRKSGSATDSENGEHITMWHIGGSAPETPAEAKPKSKRNCETASTSTSGHPMNPEQSAMCGAICRVIGLEKATRPVFVASAKWMKDGYTPDDVQVKFPAFWYSRWPGLQKDGSKQAPGLADLYKFLALATGRVKPVGIDAAPVKSVQAVKRYGPHNRNEV